MNTDKRTRLYLALDYDGQKKNLGFAREISAQVPNPNYGFKVNLDSVADFSPDAMNPFTFVEELTRLRRGVFVDLKMWNGKRTMSNIVRGCSKLGVDIVNVYAHAGVKFITALRGALAEANACNGTNTQLYGLTVLSHYTEQDCFKLYEKNLPYSVRMLAELAMKGGVDGLILPGNQLHIVSDLQVRKLCPGIRPIWYEDTRANDQEQTSTPKEAIDGGATDLVIGSPILKAPNPKENLERLLADLSLV